MCPSYQPPYLVRPNYGLNVCVSPSQLHNFRYPRDQGVVVPPDSTHVDWLTIKGATMRELSYAWRFYYHKESRPKRVLLKAGLNDLINGQDNRPEELHNINTWIQEFNSRNNVVVGPNFQTWGTRS